MASIPASLGIFNPARPHQFPEEGLFNQATTFLQHLQQCLHLYCESELLDLLITVLAGPASAWFDDQPEFTSLHDFGIALTKAFPPSESVMVQSIPASESTCETFGKSANSCPPPSQKQQGLETESEAPKVVKRNEFKKASRAEQAVKPTPTLQDIGIFDPTACNEPEFGLYSEAADFLQHLQQFRHQYRKLDLLNLLPKCLCGLASEWFKTQSKFTSLKRFSKALAKAFPPAETSSRRASSGSSDLQLRTLDVIPESMESASSQQATCARVTCKLCKQSFNSNRELYEHIRNHEALKLAKDSSLSINAVNLVCEIEEKPSATHVSPAPPARSQKSIFESAIASGAVTLLKRSSSPISTLETIQEPMEIALFQATEVTEVACRHCGETFNSKESLREHKREQHRRKPIESSLLSTNTLNSMCEDEEKSVLDDSLASPELQAPIATPKQKSKSAITSEAVASLKDSHLSLPTLETEPESAERPATCRHCKQTFKFKELLRKHKREQHAKKPATSSPLRSHAPKPVCKAEEKSAVKDVTALPASHELRTPDQEVDVQKHSIVNSLLLIDTAKSTCKVAEKSATASIAKFSEPTSEERAESRTRTAYLSARLKASRLDLPLNTFVTILETVENASIQGAACARAMCRSCKQNFNSNKELFEHIREHEALKRINTAKAACKFEEKSTSTHPPPSHEPLISTTSRNLTPDTETPLQPVSPKRSSLQLRVPNSAPKPMESASIQRIACARAICKRCKQIFNSNNKLHDHIREHHARKPVKSSDLRVPALESTYKVIEKPAASCPPAPLTPQSAPPTPPATPRSQISSAEMPSRPVSPKGSHLSIATLKITPKPVEKLPANCQLTPPPSPSRTPVRKHQDCHMQKSYLTMDDLSRMFTEKPRPFGLRPHQDRPYSPQSPDIRQSSQPCSSTASKKPYLTIENLSEMFGEKSRRKGMFQGQKNVSSRGFSSGQLRITAYFKPTANRKPSISQDSESSKQKSLNQHMAAESIRTASSEDLPEKSAELPYKLPDVSCTNLKPSAEAPSFFFILLRLLPAFLLALAFVSAISAARMGCINAYEQAISAIGRAIQ